MDGNTHETLQTIPLSTTTSSVRVQCEAFDCGALLEIEVPARQNSQAPLIVRCGNCQRLLEVWLNRGSRAVTSRTRILTNDPNSASIKPTLDFQIKPADAFNLSGMSHQQLVKPPPLSRSHHSTKFNPFSFSSVPSTSRPIFLNQDGANARSIISGTNPHRSQFALRSMPGVESRIRKDRRVRHPSPYNRFMSREVKRIKAENPDVDHRRAFRMAASNWARSPTSCQRALNESGPTTQTSADQQSMSSVGESNEVSPSQLPESTRANSSSSLHLWNGVATTKEELHPDFEEFNDQ